MSPRRCLSVFLFFFLGSGLTAFGQELSFNRDIRPILAENCFYCHGQDHNKRQGDLRLDNRDAAIEKGAIVPDDPVKGSLIQRVLSDDPDLQMPPPGSNRVLTEQQRTMLQQWVSSGAKYETHWAFVPPVKVAIPEPAFASDASSAPANPIDRFVQHMLQQRGLKPSPEADRATLIRRLSIDLTGLPPSPQEVDAFVADQDPQAYEKLVDRLLASPHYGERMALPWLDAARYADSNGFQQDGDTWQWIWRDWVVKALNEDLPFDQFTIWQIAGDLLPNATEDQKIASGFNRNHLLNGEGGAIAEEQRWVILFDRMETTSTTWLGLTMNCTQCHDHKYDPITMTDYYSLLDGFNRVPESGTPQYFSSRIRVAAPFIELPSEENKQRFREFDEQIQKADGEVKKVADAAFEGWKSGVLADGMPNELGELSAIASMLLQKPESERSDEDRKILASELRKYFDEKILPTLKDKFPAIGERDKLKQQLADYRADQMPRVMIMSDEKPRETKILSRGDYLTPTEKVSFNTPAFLPPLPESAPRNRLGFAQWLVSPEHPLTARVQVNRMWQYFFGTGFVRTAEDLGVQSEFPIHQDLLDWLSVEFRESGWSMKHMHRLIVTSATYRQSSKVTQDLLAKDPENRLYARASRFRMPSMILRDWALASSGLLNGTIGGKPVYPYQPDGIWESLAITKERDFTYPASSGKDLYRRSLYTFWRRTVGPANMFDASNRQACRVRMQPTSTPLHALTTLNDPTWTEAARVLAEHCMTHNSNLDGQLSAAFRAVLCRAPRNEELEVLRRMFQKQLTIYHADSEAAKQLLTVGAATRNESLPVADYAAMTAVCVGVMNLDESLTRE
ncbi:MAG: DUF1553 domain-containing protein [Planctomycetaceae bacterium]|nr:DUF1553 domain-containing protein [Planctomycetaceae bacterium]